MNARGEGVRADVVEVLPPTSPRMLNENGRSALLDPNVALGIPVLGAVDFNGMPYSQGAMDPRAYAAYHQAQHEQRLSLQYVKSCITFVLIYSMLDFTWKVWVSLTLDRFLHGSSE